MKKWAVQLTDQRVTFVTEGEIYKIRNQYWTDIIAIWTITKKY